MIDQEKRASTLLTVTLSALAPTAHIMPMVWAPGLFEKQEREEIVHGERLGERSRFR